jgi:hypothetical protein
MDGTVTRLHVRQSGDPEASGQLGGLAGVRIM